MEIFPRNYQFPHCPPAQHLLEHLISEQDALGLSDAIVFCEFPLFREEEEVMLSQVLLLSQQHGLVIFGAYSGSYGDGLSGLHTLISQTDSVFSQVYSKLVKSNRLRRTRTVLAFDTDAAVFAPEAPIQDQQDDETKVLISLAAVSNFLNERRMAQPLSTELFSEITSVVEGSKGLIRAKERKTDAFGPTSKVALVKQLEEEIRRFDREQRLCYMTEVFGPQRITGLAGSGKTVVIAMQAALAHLKNPEARIAVTFYTKSLYQHIKQLITRFYRQFDDRDPDWDQLRILHAWGGQVNEGLYHFAATALGETALTYNQAASINPRRPFEEACTRLLASQRISPLFDYIFVDEAQDFPPAFLQLVLKLAEEQKLVIAYDVFQTIFDVDVPSAEVLFGLAADGSPAVTFQEDLVLHKCYRNPLEVLVCAHAIGFGLYSTRPVQMLESKEHWEDFGYIVESGDLVSGSETVILRPQGNSPTSISSNAGAGNVISVTTYTQFSEEIAEVAAKIAYDIREEGLNADDILVISVDDRNARVYFSELAKKLAEIGIYTHNLQSDSFLIRNFSEKDKVTLSTVYKAKGNEAMSVYVVGIDALFHSPTARNRNIIFTAMTRAKGWLHVSGIGDSAKSFKQEVDTAITNLPRLKFPYPSEEQLIRLKRDLSRANSDEAETALDELETALSPEEYEQLLLMKLNRIRRKRKTSTVVRPRKSPLA